MYAVYLVLIDAIFKFLLKNPRVLFALVVTEVICWPQSKVLLVILIRDQDLNQEPFNFNSMLYDTPIKYNSEVHKIKICIYYMQTLRDKIHKNDILETLT